MLLQEEEGVEICRKLLLSGSRGFVVLTHWARGEWMVLFCRPRSETRRGCLGPSNINRVVSEALITQILRCFNSNSM